MLDRAENYAAERYTNLTAREREIALLAVSGLRNKAIAGDLRLCEGTVKIHLHNIFQKLGIKRRAALVEWCRGQQPDYQTRMLRSLAGAEASQPE
jgi:DNA-binding NarL/FixJ family response regulator